MRSDSPAPAARPAFDHILFPRDPIHEPAGTLARFLAELRYEDIPADVLHTAKLITLDTLGCIATGAVTPLGEKILAAYSENVEGGECCVAGTHLRLPPSLAAKVNSWLSDVLDYEDVVAGHPSATVIPAALAIAEHLNASPKRFLAGVVAGYEAGLRIHDAVRASPDAYCRFASYHAWHGLAAGAAAMTVAGGSEEEFRSALGHAAGNTNLPLWYVEYGRPAHDLKANYGQMALGGVDAALCARRGIVGPFGMLSDAYRGFAPIIGSDRFDPAQLSAGLKQDWRTRTASIKGFPSCAFLHTTAGAVAELVKRHPFDAANIEKLKIRTFARIAEWYSDSAPATPIDGQLSVEYVAAMVLLGIPPGRDWFAPELMTRDDVRNLLQKMHVEVDPDRESAYWSRGEWGSTVDVVTKDGQTFSSGRDFAPGHHSKPFTDGEVAKKFLNNLRGTPIEKNGARIVEAVMDLDRANSIAELGRLLHASSGVAR